MKTIRFSMISYLTSVVMLMPAARGQGAGTPPPDASATSTAAVAALLAQAGSIRPNLCEQSEADVKATGREFERACGVFKKSGAACRKMYAECKDHESAAIEEDFVPGQTKDVDSDRYAACPIDAIQDAKNAKEKLKDLEADIKDLEDRVATAKEKVQEATKDIETAEAERAEANSDREKEFKKEQKEKQLAQEEEQKSAQEKFEKIEEAERKLHQQKNDQDVQYSLDLAKIEGICEDLAEKELAAKVQAEAAAAQASQLKKRNLQAQLDLKSDGRTKQNNDFRARAIARCRTDETKWKKPIELLNMNYKNDRLKIENAIKELLLQKQKVITEINQTLPQKKQQEAQELQARYQKDLMTIKTKFDTKIGQCGNFNPMQTSNPAMPNMTQLPNGCTGLNAIRAQATAHQAELEKKLSDLESDKEYFTKLLRLASAQISSTEASSDLNVMSSGGAYLQALEAGARACATGAVESGTTNARMMDSAHRNYVKQGEEMGESIGDSIAAGGADPGPSPSAGSAVTPMPPAPTGSADPSAGAR